jgi:hypothetical protein
VDQCPKTQEEEEENSRVPYASAVGSLMYAIVYTTLEISHAVGVFSNNRKSFQGRNIGQLEKRFLGICVELLAMDCATKEEQDQTECCTYMFLWMHTRLEIWIIGDLQEGMCLTCLEEQLVG